MDQIIGENTEISVENTIESDRELEQYFEDTIEKGDKGEEFEYPEITTHFHSPSKVIGSLISRRLNYTRGLPVTREELENSGLFHLYEGEQVLEQLKTNGQWVSGDSPAAERAFLLTYVQRRLQKEVSPYLRREVSMESDIDDDNHVGERVVPIDSYGRGTEDAAITNILLAECLRHSNENFSDRERRTFIGVLVGKDYAQISEGTDLTQEQVKDAMKSVVTKLRILLGIEESLPFPLFRDATFNDLPPKVKEMAERTRKREADRQYHMNHRDARNAARAMRRKQNGK